ncbi:MAG TPA: ABC transporter ATP-binding protein [Myxococcaceae bacterium]|nr:ABC transporter ATP-binding protein [Myxococcaceae bacterium]
MDPPLLELKGITKRFPGVVANDHVDLALRAGEVHALLGENGAGKTTLMSILYGLQRPDEGEIRIDGRPVRIHSPREALRLGLALVPQHPLLVERHTVAENLILGQPGSFFLTRRMRQESLPVDLDARVEDLSAGQKQQVEIARALLRGARALILDEPTSVLAPPEVEQLFAQLAGIKARGVAIVFISHKLDEVLALSDRITVLRGGKKVGERARAEATREDLIRLMVGRDLLPPTAVSPPQQGVRFEVEGLEVDADSGRRAVRGASFTLAPGEVLGIAGVAGSGQRELAEALAGLRSFRGRVLLDGASISGCSPAELFARGLAHVPEDRATGAVPALNIAEALALRTYRTTLRRGSRLDLSRMTAEAARLIQEFRIAAPGPETPVRLLSGGNVQRTILARELSGPLRSADPRRDDGSGRTVSADDRSGSLRALIAVHPTYGVDVGATEQIHRLLVERAAQGVSVVLVTENIDELYALSHRVAVLFEGTLRGPWPVAEVGVERLGRLMTGRDAA